jgi:hypothetical protein
VLIVDRWSNKRVVRKSSAGKEVSAEAEDIVGIHYQATTDKNVTN